MAYTMVDIPVAGGALCAGVWGESGPLVIAAHGITAQHQAWALVGPDLGRDHRFVAPDLRGRGRSRDLPGPYGIAAHAVDIAAVARYFGEPAILVGHSLGGFIMVAATRLGVGSRLVLIDGGPLLPPPPGIEPGASREELGRQTAAAVGPAFARLSMTFADEQEYLDFWRAHPSFAEWNDAITDFVDYDLIRVDGGWRAACRPEAAERDAVELYNLTDLPEEPLPVPAVVLRGERGMFNEPEPFYPADYVERWLPGAVERFVPGVNHYSITLTPPGAAVVADAIRSG